MALTRSENMARIRGSGTRPELALRSELHRRGVRYRLGRRLEFGRPDLAFVSRRLAIFVDGCFWHGCPAHYVAPRSRKAFWSGKLHENVIRDRRQTSEAEAAGWRVLRIWEHEIEKDVGSAADRVIEALAGCPVLEEHWQVERVCRGREGERRVLIELRDEAASERIATVPCDPGGRPLIRRTSG